MTRPADPRDDEERRIREAALDRTIEASFPASDPPSTLPDPHAKADAERIAFQEDEALGKRSGRSADRRPE